MGPQSHAADIKYFQNQCILQRNYIEELYYAIRKHASRFRHAETVNDGRWGTSADNGHTSLRERYYDVERQVNAHRHAFYRFLSQGA